MNKQFVALRVIGTIYKILGVVTLGLTVLQSLLMLIGALGSGFAMSDLGDFGAAMGGLTILLTLGAVIFVFIVGSAMALGFYAVGDLVYVILGIEENTRASMNALSQLQSSMAPPPPASSQLG